MSTLDTRASSIDRALDQIGDKWCLLIIQEVLWGINAFNDMLAATGVSRGVLSDRLKWLESIDCLRKDTSGARPRYHLTGKSMDLYASALMALAWERRHNPSALTDTIELTHRNCGEAFWPIMRCRACGDEVQDKDVRYTAGPGATVDRRQKKIRRRSSKPLVASTGSVPMLTGLINLVGDRWTANIIALAYHGVERFDEFHRELPVATNILADRLKFLVEQGVFATTRYQDAPPRNAYQLTQRGKDLYPWFLSLLQWGDKWCDDMGKGRPMLLTHNCCKRSLRGQVCCSACGEELRAQEVTFKLPQ